MKIDRYGRAKIFTQGEIQLLFGKGFTLNPPRDRAPFAVDVYDRRGQVRPEIGFRKGNTKGKLATRTIPAIEELRLWLDRYHPPSLSGYLFPGRFPDTHLRADSASWILREACRLVGIEGASTHSFRRTALTQMSNAGIPLRVIQEISGHRTLDELYKYLEVRPDQVVGAVSSLSMLAPVEAAEFPVEGAEMPVPEAFPF